MAITAPLSAKDNPFPPVGLPKVVTDDIRLAGLNALATGMCKGQEMTFDASTISRQDVNDDGVDDYVVDFSGLKCGSATPLCGTGGCQTDILASTPDKSFVLAFGDQIRSLTFGRKSGKPSLVADYHGGTCGGNGTDACPKTFVYNSASFKFEPDPTPVNESQSSPSMTNEEVGKTIQEFSSYLAIYLVGRKCASSGVVFNDEAVSKMGAFIKQRFKGTPQNAKDLVWNKMSASVENDRISVADCKQDLTLAEYTFPGGLMDMKHSEANPF